MRIVDTYAFILLIRKNLPAFSVRQKIFQSMRTLLCITLTLGLIACGGTAESNKNATKNGVKDPIDDTELSISDTQRSVLFPLASEGKNIYITNCIACHGETGAGNYSINRAEFTRSKLTSFIASTMPPMDIGSCVGQCAQAAADYILNNYQALGYVNTVTQNTQNNRVFVQFLKPSEDDTIVEVSNMKIRVEASSALGMISGVKLYVDDLFIREEKIPPFEWRPETDPLLSQLTPGAHVLRIEATDMADNMATSALVLMLKTDQESTNQEDTPAMDVRFKTPAHETLLAAGSELDVVVNATSAVSTIENVRLFINDTLVRQESTAPYQWRSNQDDILKNLAPGTYQLRAEARDAANNVMSTNMTIYVGLAENKAPTIKLIQPSNDRLIREGDDLHIALDVKDAEGTIADVRLYLNDTLIRGMTETPFTWGKPVSAADKVLRNIKKGTYTFRAIAKDELGASSFIEFKVNVLPKEEQKMASGEALYKQNCASCHKPLETSEKINKKVTQIKWAMNNVKRMKSLTLTDPEIAAIVQALTRAPVNPVEDSFPATTQLFPNKNFAPINRRAYRLTKPQIVNSINLILGTELPGNSLGSDEKMGAFANHAKALTINQTDFIDNIMQLVDKRFPYSSDEQVRSFMSCSAAVDLACRQANCACVENYLSRTAKQLYRRPITSVELNEFKNLYQSLLSSGLNYVDTTKSLLSALFISPEFLFRFEASHSDHVTLTPLELLTQFSLVLTDYPPTIQDIDRVSTMQKDDPSFQKFINDYIDNQLQTERSKMIFARFLKQWLDVEVTGIPAKDSAKFPNLTASVKKAMIREVDEFIRYVVNQDKITVESLFTSTYSYLEPALATFYGVSNTGSVSVIDARQGVLGKGVYSALNAGPLATNPTRRGSKLVSEVLCHELPGLPSGVELESNNNNEQPLTNREKFEAHSRSPECASCHEVLDPLGFGLENFAADGSYRQMENGYPINAADTFEVLPFTTLNFQGPADMSVQIAAAPETLACMVRQAFRYTYGYTERAEDDPILAQAMGSYQASGFDIRALFASLLKNTLAQQRN